MPTDVLKPLEDYEKDRVTEEIEAISNDLFKKHKVDPLKNRENELKQGLSHALKYIAKRIDQGADFEVTPPSEPEVISEGAPESLKQKVEAKEKVKIEILEKGRSVTKLPERKQQILSLPEPKKTADDKK